MFKMIVEPKEGTYFFIDKRKDKIVFVFDVHLDSFDSMFDCFYKDKEISDFLEYLGFDTDIVLNDLELIAENNNYIINYAGA